ncbi:MAG: HAD-IB family phosphatase [Candidatus Lokiarchaeota archaeon]|nr:HAD-IB family phosphatase [Candidatus Lokiarchaeota archaeon]
MVSRLAALDMDGTIIKERTIDRLTKKFGIVNKLNKIDSKYKDLKEYQKSKMIANFFAGYKRKELLSEFLKIPLSEGIKDLITFLKQKNFLISIITSSYTFLARKLAEKLGIPLYFGNTLNDENGILTGEIDMPLSWAKNDCKCHSICKLTIFNNLMHKYKIKKNNSLAIGDSENDYCMLKKAGIAVAYNNNSLIVRKIPNIIISDDFHEILDILRKRIK